MQYFHAEYTTCDGEHEYHESGVLTAASEKQAERKAKTGKALFDRAGWEEFCELDRVTEIPVMDYLVLKKYEVNIDRWIDEDGSLKM